MNAVQQENGAKNAAGGVWQFWIDAGGTFTDCVALAPDGTLRTGKVLSSGVTKGRAAQVEGDQLVDPARHGEPEEFWIGYELRLLDERAQRVWSGTVTRSRSNNGGLTLAAPLPRELQRSGMHYELQSPEEAPLLAIRTILGLPLAAPLPPMEVRLGTTRGTNALLERKGARTALVVTRGFADVLLIGNQDRPRLFDLAIRKPQPLFQKVIEIDERLAADGTVLRPLDPAAVRRQLQSLQTGQVDSLAICLVHAFANPVHEEIVAGVAVELGFREVSVSSRVAPLIKLVSRGDTTVLDAYLNPVLREYVQRLERQLTPREGEAPAEPSDQRAPSANTAQQDFALPHDPDRPASA